MTDRLKSNLIGTDERKRLVTNIISLSTLQGVNYILPLLTLPYLVRVLGPELFGLLAFATATISYFMLITDYGFNLSATRQISIFRNDIDKVNQIYSSVMIIKTGLMLISLLLLSLLVFSFEIFNQNWEVYFITFAIVIGQVMFPVWLFQGMEKMKYITYLNIGAKSFFTILIFIFVKEKTDYLLVPLFTALGFFVSGICSLFLVKKTFHVRFVPQSLICIKKQLEEGWYVFISNAGKASYQSALIVILGLFTSNTIVGYFAGANKLLQAIKGLNAPITQAFYPLVSREANTKGLSSIVTPAKLIIMFMAINSLIMYAFAEQTVLLILGEEFHNSIILVQIMAFIPFLVGISAVSSNLGLLAFGYSKEYMKVYIYTSIISLVVSFILIKIYSVKGAAISVLVSECIVVFLSIYYLRKFVYAK